MIKTWMALVFGLLAAATFLGCGETPRPAAEEPTPAATGGDGELSEAEITALAERQKICPVTGEPLGSMGTPVPVLMTDSTGQEHTILICCESCRETLLDNPDGYLAKLISAQADESDGG